MSTSIKENVVKKCKNVYFCKIKSRKNIADVYFGK